MRCHRVAICIFVGVVACSADEITLVPVQDTTIYEEQTTFGNGSGAHLFSGATANRNGGAVRRALLSFDVSTIPADATITDVAVGMNVNRVPGGAPTVDMSLHRLTAAFGEGTSDASGNEGRGTQAANGDATWDSAILGTSDWNQPGGDFVDEASAVTAVGGQGSYTWESTEQLVADVQLWINSPELNFGWILIGDESTRRSAKRFDSAQASNASRHPMLNITFEATPSIVGDYNQDGELGVPDINLLCDAINGGANPNDFDLTTDGVVDGSDLETWLNDLADSFLGDADLDGDVDFDDFVNLTLGFGQPGNWHNGDFDCSAAVDFDDFVTLSLNFGQSVPQAEGALASVPEPSSTTLLAVTMLGVLGRRRKRA